ncbi:hypothetical protein AB2M62_02120 [Sphingomonas sp. MMS12-HWE2-04]|uniref:hypothetical protein n=1 Tax=Sphingomonas sp. MMS12-HWE2-04 TaxID=3234199 RepID=UPI003851521B
MSHDQRPGKMRVVADAPSQDRRSAGSAPGAAGNAVALPAPATAVNAPAEVTAKQGGLPILGALVFLVSATIGGVLIALSGLAG